MKILLDTEIKKTVQYDDIHELALKGSDFISDGYREVIDKEELDKGNVIADYIKRVKRHY